MHGRRLDSQLRQVQFLFDEIEIGLRFVRAAEKMDGGMYRAKTLSFAQMAHNIVSRRIAHAPVTADERARLGKGLRGLQSAIDDCLDALVE